MGDKEISQMNAGIESIKDVLGGEEEGDQQDQRMTVFRLNLHGNNITSLDHVDKFERLIELNLSSNLIENISTESLRPLINLQVLNLSCNRLSSTLGLPILPSLHTLLLAYNRIEKLTGLLRPIKTLSLKRLDLRDNEIANLEDIMDLSELPALEELEFQSNDGTQSNPICDMPNYVARLFQILPSLSSLDGKSSAQLPVLDASSAMNDPTNTPRFDFVSKAFRDRAIHFKKIKELTHRTDEKLHAVVGLEKEIRFDLFENRLQLLEADRIRTRRDTKQEKDISEKNQKQSAHNECNNTTHDETQTSPSDVETTNSYPKIAIQSTTLVNSRNMQLASPLVSYPITTSSDARSECNLSVNSVDDAACQCDMLDEPPMSMEESCQCELIDTNHIAVLENKVTLMDAQIALSKENLDIAELRASKAEASLVNMSAEVIALKQVVKKNDSRASEELHRGELEEHRQLQSENSKLRQDYEILSRSAEELKRRLQTAETERALNEEVGERMKRSTHDLTLIVEQNAEKIRKQDAEIAHLKSELEYSRVREKTTFELQKHSQHKDMELYQSMERDLRMAKTAYGTLQDDFEKKIREITRLTKTVEDKELEYQALLSRNLSLQDQHQKELAAKEMMCNRRLENAVQETEAVLRRNAAASSLATQQHQTLAKKMSLKIAALEEKLSVLSRKEVEERSKSVEVEKELLVKTRMLASFGNLYRTNALAMMKKKVSQLSFDHVDLRKIILEKIQVCQNNSYQELYKLMDLIQKYKHTQEQQMDALRFANQDNIRTMKIKQAMLDDKQAYITELKRKYEVSSVQMKTYVAQLEEKNKDLKRSLSEQVATCTSLKNEVQDAAKQLETLEIVRKQLKSLELEHEDLQEQLHLKDEAIQFIEKELVRMRDLFSTQEKKGQERLSVQSEQFDQEQKALADQLNQKEQKIISIQEKSQQLEKELLQMHEDRKVIAQRAHAAEEKVLATEQEMKILLRQMDTERKENKENLQKVQDFIHSFRSPNNFAKLNM